MPEMNPLEEMSQALTGSTAAVTETQAAPPMQSEDGNEEVVVDDLEMLSREGNVDEKVSEQPAPKENQPPQKEETNNEPEELPEIGDEDEVVLTGAQYREFLKNMDRASAIPESKPIETPAESAPAEKPTVPAGSSMNFFDNAYRPVNINPDAEVDNPAVMTQILNEFGKDLMTQVVEMVQKGVPKAVALQSADVMHTGLAADAVFRSNPLFEQMPNAVYKAVIDAQAQLGGDATHIQVAKKATEHLRTEVVKFRNIQASANKQTQRKRLDLTGRNHVQMARSGVSPRNFGGAPGEPSGDPTLDALRSVGSEATEPIGIVDFFQQKR